MRSFLGHCTPRRTVCAELARALLSCALLILVCAGSRTLIAQLTVQQALAAPFRNQLTAAPAKARIAWFTDHEGRRNIWVASTREPAHPVTGNTADDGQDIDNISWSRDAERLAWTRGTGAAGGDHTLPANPAELPGPVHQHLEWIDLREEHDRRPPSVHTVQDGHSPMFTADGQHLVFLRRGAIWIADLNSKEGRSIPPHTTEWHAADAQKLPGTADPSPTHAPGIQQLITARGSAGSLRLSPDGLHLAFVSDRGDHSFIGVYTFATNALQWMDPGTGLDHDPVWSPDGKRIAFVREVPIVSPIADRWMRQGSPWSIRIAEVATGNAREQWQADPGPGSLFHGISAHDQLIWMHDNSIVFPWEKTGFVQLYRTDLQAGGAPTPISYSAPTAGTLHAPASPGNTLEGWEVDGAASDGERVFFTANAHPGTTADIDRRHLWLVTRTSPPHLVSGGEQLATDPALLSDGSIAFLQGSPTEPFKPLLLSGDPLHPKVSSLDIQRVIEPSFVTPEPVTFTAADGAPVRGQLFLPNTCKGSAQKTSASPCTRLPAVVFFHGGSRRQMLLGFHPMQYYFQAYEFNQYLASRGFAVLSVNYRSGTGYGLNFRQALHYGANGGSEDNDVIGAARYLQSRPEIDAHRIGAWGGSYGGYLTALALARHSDLYAAGVDLHGVHDWSLELDLWKPSNEPGADQAEIAHRAFQSSPMASLDTWKSPVLLIQGDDDRNVLFAQTVRLATELRARGVHVEEKVFPDEVHDFLLHRNWITAYQLAAQFLEQNLAIHAAP